MKNGLAKYVTLEYQDKYDKDGFLLLQQDILICFTVKREWAQKWFDENVKGSETRGLIDKEVYESLEDFEKDYIWEDSWQMYMAAVIANAVIEKERL